VARDQRKNGGQNAYRFFGYGAFFLFFFSLLAFVLYTPLSYLSSALLAINCVAFYLCGYDKAAARSGGPEASDKHKSQDKSSADKKKAGAKGSLRVPEKVFYAIALLGGAPLLLVAMRLFRHKTKKASFHFFLGLIIISQITLLAYLNQLFGPLFVRS
jgi:uncharacterized membrane protein YsdA (DUF1294 family)